MEFLNEFTMAVIVGICLCVGYVVKKWIKDVDNKYIPTICAVIGVVISLWINNFVPTPENILTGLFSGLSATGLHQAFVKLIEHKTD